MWVDNLKAMKEQSGMTTKEISVKSGIPEPTLEKLFAGATKDPKLATMQQIVHFFGRTLDDLDDSSEKASACSKQIFDNLTSEEQSHIKKYRLLDPHGKEAVDSILDIEHRRCLEELKRKQEEHKTEESSEPGAESILYYFPMYDTPMSAGTGQAAGQGYPENVRLVKEPPRGASYIAPVCGDSMAPTYQDGELLFIHAAPEIEPGQVGVFLMDGQQWVKELGDGVLISHNSEYAPIPFEEGIQCQGLVLGVCNDSYFEQ